MLVSGQIDCERKAWTITRWECELNCWENNEHRAMIFCINLWILEWNAWIWIWWRPLLYIQATWKKIKLTCLSMIISFSPISELNCNCQIEPWALNCHLHLPSLCFRRAHWFKTILPQIWGSLLGGLILKVRNNNTQQINKIFYV